MHPNRMPRSDRLRLNACLPVVLALSAMVAGCAAPVAAASQPVIDKEMDAFLQAHLATGRFMGSVLVARGDEVLHRAGYGMANLELDAPMTPESVLRIGSVTKQFTAAAILQLRDQGLLEVHDPVSRYLPDYPHGDEITIHQLLNLTSGIPDFEYNPESRALFRQGADLDTLIATFSGLPLDFPPGSQWSYSNSNYAVLTAILEKLTGQRYADYLTEHIFVPLGMTATGYDDPMALLPHRAAGYTWDGSDYHNAEFLDMSIPSGAGALYSTVLDLYRWDRSLYAGGLLSAESQQAFFTPSVSIGPGQRYEGYAYGWGTLETEGRSLLAHGGGINGFAAFVLRDPSEQLYVALLTNVENGPVEAIAMGLAAIAYGEPYAMPSERTAIELDPAILERYAGTYQVNPDLTAILTAESGHLYMQAGDQPQFELFPESETSFFAKVAELQVLFQLDPDGLVTGLVVHEGANEITAEKMP
jgi:CubicO group peptidase (beta-lactamase class C family)